MIPPGTVNLIRKKVLWRVDGMNLPFTDLILIIREPSVELMNWRGKSQWLIL